MLTSHPLQQILQDYWSVGVELLASYTLVLAGLTSRSSPLGVGLLFAALAHMASTARSPTGKGYYLQANPSLTLGQLLRGRISLFQALLVRRDHLPYCLTYA